MKILFKVIVLVSVLLICFALYRSYNTFHITRFQFALAYGLVILIGGIVIGWLTDYDFKNQSLYDNREKDPLSDWVKIQDRDKSKTRWGKFWNELFGDPDADWLLDQMLQSELGNYYDRNELKSVEEITQGNIIKQRNYVAGGVVPNKMQPPMLVVDEVYRNNPKTIKQIISEYTVPSIRKPYERYAGEFEEQYRNRLKSNMPAWLFDETGDAVNPLDHEQSK